MATAATSICPLRSLTADDVAGSPRRTLLATDAVRYISFMKSFEVVSNGVVYEARHLTEGAGGLADTVMLSASLQLGDKLVVREGLNGPVVASMDHNLAQTVFQCHGGSGETLAELSFAWFTVKNGFALKMGEHEYKVEERKPSLFSCVSETGATLMIIEAEKHFLGADRWRVSFAEQFPAPLALLSVVALRQRRA